MMQTLDRRLFLGALGGAAVVGLGQPVLAAPTSFVMWHSPGCGCCLEWGRRVESAFRRPLRVIETADIAGIKRAHGVPADLQSCHTALIGGIVLEGHVPPADIRRLIDGGRRGLGLAVPGMPIGSPGMDVGHDQRQPYAVYAFNNRGGRTVFARHGGAR